MGTWAEELSAVLRHEEQLLHQLETEARRKTQALKTGDVQGIDRIVNREMPLAMQLDVAERKRLRIMEDNGFAGFTLRQIIEQADGARQEELTALLKSLAEVSAKLHRLNDLNTELTNTRLEFYRFLQGADKATYGNSGRTRQGAAQTALMDQRI